MSEMSQAQVPATTGASSPLDGGVPEVTEDLDRADRTDSGDAPTGSVAPSDFTEDGLLTADVGPDHNEQSEGDQAEPGDPDSASDPMPDIAGTGS